jgi:hypothetical protein
MVCYSLGAKCSLIQIPDLSGAIQESGEESHPRSEEGSALQGCQGEIVSDNDDPRVI